MTEAAVRVAYTAHDREVRLTKAGEVRVVCTCETAEVAFDVANAMNAAQTFRELWAQIEFPADLEGDAKAMATVDRSVAFQMARELIAVGALTLMTRPEGNPMKRLRAGYLGVVCPVDAQKAIDARAIDRAVNAIPETQVIPAAFDPEKLLRKDR